MKHLILIILSITLAHASFSQDNTVKGRVVSYLDGQPLAGVNVVIKGTHQGVVTNIDGGYELHAAPNDTLIFSFVGYETVEVPVQERKEINVELAEGLELLQEIAILSTGYEEVSPERATGSYSHIDSQLLDRNVGTDLNSRLNGITPSLLMDSRGGDNTFLNIRGRSTILANDQPLIVVDNFPYNGDINTINPNDIESITVLRDAAAASIWGVRAGNGVIVITTKKGRTDSPLRVGFNANVTMGEMPDLFYRDRISTGDFIDVEQMLFDNGYYDATLSDTRMPAVSPVVEILSRQRSGEISEEEANAQLDALRENDVRNELEEYFYRETIKQQYALNLRGGTKNHAWYFSTGYDHNLASRVGNKDDRLTLNLQHTFHPIPNLELDSRIVYTQSNRTTDYTLSEIRMGSRSIYPYARFTDEQGNPVPISKDYREDFVADAEERGFLNWQFNPIEEPDHTDNTFNLNNIRAATSFKYTLLEGLDAEVRYQYERQASELENLQSAESYYTRNLINRFSTFDGDQVTERHIPVGGILTFSNNGLTSHSGRGQLNFNKQWSDHSLSALAGVEVRETKTTGHSRRLYGYDPSLGSSSPVNYADPYVTYPDNNFATIPDLQGVSGTADRFRSWYVNAAYTFRERYTLSASSRVDQSNLFGVKSNQRSAPLWSVGGKWNLHRESFFDTGLFPMLALRVTYGYNGNIDQDVTAYTTARFITASNSQRQAAILVSPPNPELRWERSGMLNFGVDFGLKDDVLTGRIEYYRKRGVDLMGRGPLDPTKGMNSYKGNIAGMKGHGLDAELNSINVDGALGWQTSLLFSYTRDEVTDYELTPASISQYFRDGSINRYPDQFTPVEGKPLFSIYSYPWAGLDPDTGDPQGYLNGEPSSNYAGISNAATVDSLKYHGPARPPVFGSLRNTVSYGGWSLSFNITYRFGHYFHRPSINYTSLYTLYEGHGDFDERWQQPGDEQHTQVPSMIYPANADRDAFYSNSEVLVEKGDHIRWQDVRLSYEFAKIRLGETEIRRLQLYGYLNNVGLIWKANDAGIDPAFPDMPPARTYAFGISMEF